MTEKNYSMTLRIVEISESNAGGTKINSKRLLLGWDNLNFSKSNFTKVLKKLPLLVFGVRKQSDLKD